MVTFRRNDGEEEFDSELDGLDLGQVVGCSERRVGEGGQPRNLVDRS